MRKFIPIVLSVLLVLSFSAIAFAIHVPDVPLEEQTVTAAGAKITLGGRILVRGWYFNGVNLGKTIPVVALGVPLTVNTKTPTYLPDEDASSAALYTTNAYLVVNAKLSDNLQAYMELETADNRVGTSGLYKWGSLDQKAVADLFFRELWIQYTGSGLLGVPSGIKVGHMPLTLGEKQFLNHERFGDDAIIVFVNPVKELELAALTAKLSEGAVEKFSILGQTITVGGAWQDNTDDTDYYGVLGKYKLDKDNTIGANYSYINNSDAELNFHNIGLHANGMLMGALSYAAELDYQFGDVQDSDDPTNSIDFKGYGLMAKVGYKIDPVNLRASFAYGSGDDDPNDGEIGEFEATVGNDDISPLARFVHYTQIYERTVRTAAKDQGLGGTSRSTGIANTTYGNLGLDLAPMKALSLSLDGFLLRATKTDLWEDEVGHSVSEDIGWELDFRGSYKITKNLTYFVEAAGFFPGDFYKDAFGGDKQDQTVTQIVHGLNLTF